MISITPKKAARYAKNLLLSTLLLSLLPAFALRMNGAEIPQHKIDIMRQIARLNGLPQNDETEQAVLDRVVILELLNQQAQSLELQKNPEFLKAVSSIQAEIAKDEQLGQLGPDFVGFANQNQLAQFYLDYITQTQIINDRMLISTYKALKDNQQRLMNEKKYHASHILVARLDEAQAIQEALNNQQDFATLAKARSIDPSARTNAGDLGWIAHPETQLVAPFAKALTSMKPNTTSEPIQTEFGWHIIRLHDVKVGVDDEGMPIGQAEPVYQIRQIVVSSPQEAYKAVDQLKKGKRFDLLAAQMSQEADHETRRGALPPMTKENLATFGLPFQEAVIHAPVGKLMLTPIQSNFGWHIFVVESVKTNRFPAFAAMKNELIALSKDIHAADIQQGIEQHIEQLKKATKIEY